MATIAKGMITLSSVNDAYSVSLSPSSCVINAKWNGEDPDYSNAYSDITVYRGEEAVAFKMLVIQSSNIGNWTVENISTTSKRIKIDKLAANKLTASLKIQISVESEFSTIVNLPVTVVRETSMLDWILDWEGREKTEIAGEWIITPKIFVGKSENGGQLTGTYIGPAFDGSGKTGVFGYSGGKEIFHLDNTGGMIGGWEIQDGGIQTSDGTLKILSEGTIISAPGGTTAWELKKDGSASFASGKVKFYANGNATFEGTITSQAGEIGGWKIGQHSLRNQSILIDSKGNYIGIYNSSTLTNNTERTVDDFHKTVQIYGGVAMFYTSDSSYGIEGWLPCGSVTQIAENKRIFSLGSINKIAGWHFNEDSLWYGEDIKTNNVTQYARVNTEGAFTTVPNAITIGSKGLRGNTWYIDADGTAQFVSGAVKFNASDGELFGWKMNSGRLSASHAALVSNLYYCGIFISPTDITNTHYTSLVHVINNNGGIYIYSDGANSVMRAYDTDGKLGFALQTNGYHTIGAWNFNHQTIYIGSDTPDSSTKFMSKTSQMVLSASVGLIGHKWRLSADGSGAIAGGHISWTADGTINLDDTVTIKWTNVTGTSAVTDKLTKIDANGIYTGTISADKITSGTISTANIKNASGTWYLNQDGSGCLANGHVTWDKDGKLTLNAIDAQSGTIGGWIINDNKLKSQNGNTWLNGQTGEVRLKGTIQHSTGTSGNFSDVDLFSLPAITSPKSSAISMGEEETDIGKRCLLTNMSQYGSNGVYKILIRRFGWTHQSGGMRVQYNEAGEYYNIFPGETVEMTCFALNSGDKVMGNTIEGGGYWKITARYNREIARVVAMGSVTNTTSGATISGWTVGGTNLTVERSGTGNNDATYTIQLPEIFQYVKNLCVLLTGVGTCQGTNSLPKATVVSHSQRTIVVRVSDDSTDNAGSFNFVCYDINGWQF